MPDLKLEAELELAPELTEVADDESLPHLALELEPGPEIVMAGTGYSVRQIRLVLPAELGNKT